MLSRREYARLATERPNPRTRDLDARGTLEVVLLINREDALVARAVGRQARAIAKAASVVASALSGGRALVFVGAGTSGRLAVMEAAECPPTFGTPPKQIRAVIAGGPGAVFEAKEGAEDDLGAGQNAVTKLGKGDVVIGIAASGVTPFVRGALLRARKRGARTILVTANRRPPGNPAEITIAPEVGPEVLAGSTRMKAGTSAKMVVNTLMTAAMVRVGKVYDRWMVDLRPMSRKLRLRAVRLVALIGRVPEPKALALLKRAGWNAKSAILMARLGLSAAQARNRLSKADGRLRTTLAARQEKK